MKKLTYLLASAAVLAACQSQPNSYKITGTLGDGIEVEDSTIAVLLKLEGGQPIFLDTAKVENKQFVFEGKADSAEVVNIYFFKKGNDRPQFGGMNVVLENGNINVSLDKEKTKIEGTTYNNTLNAFNQQVDSLSNIMRQAYEAAQDTALSEEARNAKMAELQKLSEEKNKEYQDLSLAFIENNIGNILGYTQFLQMYSSLPLEKQSELIAKLPTQYANTEAAKAIKESIEAEKKTAVGQKFIDMTMKTPDGKDLKLSDIVSKSKVTLVDFWASWCGPCRAEMPNVVKAYKEYKGKGFEIVGVSFDEKADDWKKAIKELNITWPQMSDLKGWQSEGAKLYNVRGIPATVLIGQDGTILAKDLRGEALNEKLKEVLK